MATTQMELELHPDVPDVSLHSIPCSIDYRGPAKVDDCFSTALRASKEGDPAVLHSSFRGRPLIGQKTEIPAEFVGVVLEQRHGGAGVKGQFSSFTRWNLDAVPSDSDAMARSLDWLQVASILSQPLPPTAESE